MTTASELVKQAFRESNLIPIGQSPTLAESSEGLSRLNNLLFSLFGHELGVKLMDWPVPPSRTEPTPARYPLLPRNEDLPSTVWPQPPANVRLLTKNATPATIFFPASPNDGARMQLRDIGSTAGITLDGNGRLIESSAVLTGTAASFSGRVWFYRADLGDWLRIDQELTDTSESPFPKEFDDLFITGLSIRLSARFGNEPIAATVATFERMIAILKTRFHQEQRVPPDDSLTRRHDDTSLFNTGHLI